MEMNWNKLDAKLSASTKKTIQQMGFKRMTPVQVRLREGMYIWM
jgi:superfamily II DNA/RNA helicase